jgi:hypothetical protein
LERPRQLFSNKQTKKKLTPWNRVLLEKLVVQQLVRFLMSYGTGRFIIFSSMPRPSNRCVSFRFYQQNPLCSSVLPMKLCYFDHMNNVWAGDRDRWQALVKAVMNLLVS